MATTGNTEEEEEEEETILIPNLNVLFSSKVNVISYTTVLQCSLLL